MSDSLSLDLTLTERTVLTDTLKLAISKMEDAKLAAHQAGGSVPGFDLIIAINSDILNKLRVLEG